jgi:hypothetical protein
LIANKGSVLNIAGLFNNFSGTTLMGGTYSVAGTLEFQNANIAANVLTQVPSEFFPSSRFR